jgi:hypothetical protein
VITIGEKTVIKKTSPVIGAGLGIARLPALAQADRGLT